MVKGEDRLKEKLADVLPEKTSHGQAGAGEGARRRPIHAVLQRERYADGVLADVGRLKAEGFELIKLKNLWHAEPVQRHQQPVA